MKCIIKTVEKDKVHSLGEPKEIVVDSYEWEQDGHTGKTYSYHMSKERFERPIRKAYEILIARKDDDSDAAGYRLATIGYYDFVDYNYEDCVGDRTVEDAAKQFGTSSEEIYEVIRKPLDKLQYMVREEFAQTEEAQTKKEHETVIRNYKHAKREFAMQFGFSELDYDRCYNVYGNLMDAEHLERLQQVLKEREESKQQSKKYRKEYYRSKYNESLHSGDGGTDYSEEEREMLIKFYKILAKKYHPDANPGEDTQDEMMLINKLKKTWRI